MNIETKTINDLRTLSSTPTAGTFYYITDPGKEGEWYYAGQTTTFTDNLGTELNSGWVGSTPPSPTIASPVNKFKRVYDAGFVTATWFFDSSDPDATLGIQRALDFISPTNVLDYYGLGGGTVFLPKGTYLISKTLLIGQNCRLIGVNNRYHFVYQNNVNSGGTVIKANFSIDNSDNWVISSATYKSGTIDLLPYDITLSRAWSSTINYSYDNFCYRMGINIENLTIDGGGNNAFGGIRLSNAGNSTIRNVGVFNAKCGLLVNTCWGGSLENCFVNVIWYGILVSNCNSFVVSDCYTRYNGNNEDLIPNDQLPYFIISDLNNPDPPAPGINYNNWDLNDNVKYGKTGIFCIHSRSIGLYGNCVELTANGISVLNSTASITSTYLEGIKYYGVVQGIAIDEIQLLIDQLFSYNVGSLFCFGKNTVAKLSAIDCFYDQFTILENKLYETNISPNRNITFTNVSYHKRKYMPDILFIDEGEYGQNYGSVYVDPINGNDDNYGFNKNDAVKTFDAALIRVQNQSTINPVKTIFLKATEEVPLEGGNPQIGAAIKNLDIVSIQNADLLITSYDVTVRKPKGRLYFIGDPSGQQLAMVGQIELLQNVNLYFSNVDIYTNDALQMSSNSVNLTLFGLKSSYAKVTFDSDYSPILPSPFSEANIYINFCYFLFQANNSIINTNRKDSLLDVKFLNIVLSSNLTFAVTLSPDIPFAPAILGVDCVQISSILPIANYSLPNKGWNNSIIIRNNF